MYARDNKMVLTLWRGLLFSYLAYTVFSGPSFGDMWNQSTFLHLWSANGTEWP